tara:strand:- start:693 stop:1112 length:420 start_codon:yes stop_codon:yes gene_type:complete
MEDEFFATIKFVSGEEIICRITNCPEDDVVLIFEPMMVEHIRHKRKQLKVEGFGLTEWMHSTFDDSFFIPKKHILTMTECDPKIRAFYLKCISEDKKAKNLNKQMTEGKMVVDPNKIIPGYVGSVLEARKMLEKIFKTS